MKLEEFVTEETTQLMEFASAWREHNAEDPKRFPHSLCQWAWFKQYMAYCANRAEDKAKAVAKQDQEKDAA